MVREIVDIHKAMQCNLQRSKNYFDFLLKGIRQFVGFLLTLQVLYGVDFVLIR